LRLIFTSYSLILITSEVIFDTSDMVTFPFVGFGNKLNNSNSKSFIAKIVSIDEYILISK